MQGGKELVAMLDELGKIDPKRPYDSGVFDALVRVTVSVAIEAVCLRLNPNKEIEVYLTQRSITETYPGEWHCPGTLLRRREEIEDAFSRLAEREFRARLKSWRFVANVNLPKETRGHTFSVVHLCQFEEGPNSRGRWFLISQLPIPTVEAHAKQIIPLAVGAFVA